MNDELWDTKKVPAKNFTEHKIWFVMKIIGVFYVGDSYRKNHIY